MKCKYQLTALGHWMKCKKHQLTALGHWLSKFEACLRLGTYGY